MHTPEHRAYYSLAFFGLLVSFEAFVVSLPLFPTGDSGLHLYYSAIFRSLVLHTSPFYAQFYAVRHLVQPYSLHYYALIALCSFLSPDAAEKAVVMVVFATLALGFRQLVQVFSRRSPGLTLLVFPFLLSWPVAMGALNYVFAVGLLFFAIAAYERLPGSGPRAWPFWRFAGLLLLLVLSHPVPLLILLCFLAVDQLLRLWQEPRSWNRARFYRVLALGCTCLAFAVPILIADKAEVGKSVNDLTFHGYYLAEIYRSSRLPMFFAGGNLGRIYGKSYLLSFPAALCFVLASGFLTRLRTRTLTSFDRLALFTALFLIASLFAPRDINGSSFFAWRLWLPCWLLGIASCSGVLRGKAWNLAVATFGVVLSVMSLGLAQHLLRPVAVRSAEVEQAPLPTHALGLFVQSETGERADVLSLQYPLYFWNAGRAFTAHGDVLLNSAWLNLTILPLRENGRSGLLRDYADMVATENPNKLAGYLVEHPAERARVLQTADFILFVDPDPSHPDPTALARYTLGPLIDEWQCNAARDTSICLKKPVRAGS